MSQYFREPYKRSSGNMKSVLDLSNYPTKADTEEATGIDISTLASKTKLASLETKVENLDVLKLMTAPPDDLSKLSNVVDNDVKKTVYYKFLIKINTIYTKIPCTDELVSKKLYDLCKQGFKEKIKAKKDTQY